MMRFCRLFPLVGLILHGRLAAQAVHSSQPARADQVRIAEARRLARELADQVWPGLAGTPMPVLLVTDSAEFLIRRSPDRPDWSRPRTLPPTLVATFPVDGAPTIVVRWTARPRLWWAPPSGPARRPPNGR
jgi:hypothetical protein